jgi:hypothetical protein
MNLATRIGLIAALAWVPAGCSHKPSGTPAPADLQGEPDAAETPEEPPSSLPVPTNDAASPATAAAGDGSAVGIPHDVNETRQLVTYWDKRHRECVTTSTPEGARAAVNVGYLQGRAQGEVFAAPAEGRLPLMLLYNPYSHDNVTVATAQGESSALAFGYVFVRVEGYVYAAQQPDTRPLKLFFGAKNADNCTIAAPEDEKALLAAGYTFVRIEGYVPAR